MPAKVQQELCRDCHVPIPEVEARRIGHVGLCESCRDKHRAAWKEEHTRKPGDNRSGWLIGDECRVKLGKVEYDAKILDMSDISVADKHNYWLTKLELSKTVQGLDGKAYTQTWIHPEPVQTYKLRKRYVQ